MHAIRLHSLIMTLSLMVSQMAVGQMPQPMRDANFGRTLPPSGIYPVQNSGVYPAQYQRYGKPNYSKSQRPAASSNSKSLVDRLLQPREPEGPTIDYNKYSVSGTQPPLQNYQPGGTPGANGAKAGIRTQQPNRTQLPNSTRQANRSQQPMRTQPLGALSQRQAADSKKASRKPGVGQPPVPSLEDAKAPIYAKDSLPARNSTSRSARNATSRPPASTNTSRLQPVPSGLFPKSTTPQVAKSPRKPEVRAELKTALPKAGPETTSARTNKQEPTASLNRKLAPKVARVPLPTAQPEMLGSVTEKKESAGSTRGQTLDTGADAQVSTMDQAKEVARLDERPQSKNAKVPSQLVGSQSAAKAKLKSKVSAQYMTAKLPSKTTPPSDSSKTEGQSADSSPLPGASLAPPALPPVSRLPAQTQIAMPDLPLNPNLTTDSPNASAAKDVRQPSVKRLPLPESPTEVKSKDNAKTESSIKLPQLDSSTKTPSSSGVKTPINSSKLEAGASLPQELKRENLPLEPQATQKPIESVSNKNSGSLAVPTLSAPQTLELPSLERKDAPKEAPQSTLPNVPNAPVAVRPKMDMRVPATVENTPSSLPALREHSQAKEKPAITIQPKSATGNQLPNLPGAVAVPTDSARVNRSAAEPRHSLLGNQETKKETKNQLRTSAAGSPNPLGRTFGLPERGAYPLDGSPRLNMETPGLQVLFNGPETVSVAAPAEYELVVINRDSVDLNGLILRLEIPVGVSLQTIDKQAEFDVEKAPNGATLLTWGVEKLVANEEIRAKLTLVTRKTTDFAIGLDWTLVPISDQAAVRVISPSLKTALIGPKDVVFGESNTYRLRVKNEGEASAENVKLQIMVPSLGTHRAELGELGPGQEATREFNIAFQQQGAVELQAVATGGNNLRAPAATSVQVRRQRVVAQLTAPQLVYHGHSVAYRVLLNNKGDANSKNCFGRLLLPKGAKPVGLPYNAKVENGSLVWDVSPISPGQTVEYNFQLSLSGDGEHLAAFQCPDDVGNAIVASTTTRLQSIADLRLIVSDPVAPAPVDSEVAYELTLTNRGSKAASNVRVIGQFSKGIEPVRASGAKYRQVPGQVFFDAIPSIDAGDSVKLKIFATASEGGMHRFRAEVRSDSDTGRLLQEESTKFMGSSTQIAAPPITSSPLR